MVSQIRLQDKDFTEQDFLASYLREGIYLNAHNTFKGFLLPKPYEYADIEFQSFDPSEVKPTAKYVLRQNLTLIEALDLELSERGIDIFDLDIVLHQPVDQLLGNG